VTSERSIELQRQKDIIEQWLNTPGIPVDAHAKLLQMLSEVNEEINSFVTSNKYFVEARHLTT
jgi:cell division FtsZ-interacting protein ZapD